MARDSTLEQTRLLAGVLMHVSRYLDTGCPRAAHQAGLLLRCLDGSALDQELMLSCEQLDQAISHSRFPGGMGAGGDGATLRRPRVPAVSFPN
jgi:hypothetical protein